MSRVHLHSRITENEWRAKKLSRKWSKKEQSLLEELWFTAQKETLIEKLPGRSYSAMKRKVKNMGLKKPDASQLDQKEMIKHLESLGFKVAKHAPITDKLFNLDTERYNGENVKIGVVSDTHLGSNHQQLTHLKTIYQRFADEGIKIVLHAGDICQGINMYPGWYQETFLHNFDRQAEYIIKHYPKHEGMKTYVILGN